MKSLRCVLPAGAPHWVGDGFPVRTAFTYQNAGRELSPFLMLDHAGPTRFEPTSGLRGVGEHPHRGFETVSIVYAGEVDHRDSHGGGGSIGPGDVQWMTAGAGLVHEEFHSRAYAQQGGPFEMIQLWVNLPARHKMAPPAYQAITARDIPVVERPEGGGSVRLIAGDALGQRGAARSFTPMQVWDMKLDAGRTTWHANEGWGVGLLVLRGRLVVDGRDVMPGQMAVYSLSGTTLEIDAGEPASVLWLSGQPIDEPIAGYGPFVMNTKQEILQAMQDFQEGRMGSLVAAASPSPTTA